MSCKVEKILKRKTQSRIKIFLNNKNQSNFLLYKIFNIFTIFIKIIF